MNVRCTFDTVFLAFMKRKVHYIYEEYFIALLAVLTSTKV